MHPLVLAADVGTTNIKATVFDEEGCLGAPSSVEAPPVEAGSGGFDAEATLEGLVEAMSRAAARAEGEVEAIALSSQRASLVVVGEDSRARGPALSWQGTSCVAAASRFFARVGPERFREITGLLPNPICSVAKLAHLAEEDRASIEWPARVALLHDYLLARLGGGELSTDPSNASATGLFDLGTGRWSEELLEALGPVALEALPRIEPAGARAGRLGGEAARRLGLAEGTPLVVGGGWSAST